MPASLQRVIWWSRRIAAVPIGAAARKGRASSIKSLTLQKMCLSHSLRQAVSPSEIQIAFDRPIDPILLKQLQNELNDQRKELCFGGRSI